MEVYLNIRFCIFIFQIQQDLLNNSQTGFISESLICCQNLKQNLWSKHARNVICDKPSVLLRLSMFVTVGIQNENYLDFFPGNWNQYGGEWKKNRELIMHLCSYCFFFACFTYSSSFSLSDKYRSCRKRYRIVNKHGKNIKTLMGYQESNKLVYAYYYCCDFVNEY
jgi:hypothetical protein